MLDYPEAHLLLVDYSRSSHSPAGVCGWGPGLGWQTVVPVTGRCVRTGELGLWARCVPVPVCHVLVGSGDVAHLIDGSRKAEPAPRPPRQRRGADGDPGDHLSHPLTQPRQPSQGSSGSCRLLPRKAEGQRLLLCHSAPCPQECPGESWNHGAAPASSSSASDRTLPSAADLCSRNPASPPPRAMSSAGPQQVFQKHSARRGVGWVRVMNALPGSSGLRNPPKWLCSAAGKMKGRAGFADGSLLWLRCSLVPFLEDVLVSGCPRARQGEPRVLK